MRWNISNAIMLCSEHHTDSSEFSAHRTPKKFKKFIGIDYMNDLKKRSQDIKKLTYKEVYDYLNHTGEYPVKKEQI